MLTSYGLCQNVGYNWVKHCGGNGNNAILESDIDGNYNLISVGTFYLDLDVNTSPGTSMLYATSFPNSFIQKLGPTGNYLWAKKLESGSDNRIFSVDIDNSNNIYVTGHYKGWTDFNWPGASVMANTSGGNDSFIAKYDSNGNLLWLNTYGSGSKGGHSIHLTDNNKIITTGIFSGQVEFDPGSGDYIQGQWSDNTYILQLDSDGNFERVGVIDGRFDWTEEAITTDSIGNIYLTGNLPYSGDLDPDTSQTYIMNTNGSYDFFLLKLDSSGIFQWAKQWGGTGQDKGLAIELDQDLNIYVSGKYSGQLDIDPGPDTLMVSGTSSNLFIQKYDVNGNMKWTKTFSASTLFNTGDLELDGNGSIYLSGSFGNWAFNNPDTIDFDPSQAVFELSSIGYSHTGFMLSLDTSGQFNWAKEFKGTTGGTGSIVKSINCVAGGDLYVSGSHKGLVDFDPGYNTQFFTPDYDENLFFLFLDSCNSVNVVDSINTCDNYTWVNGQQYFNNITTSAVVGETVNGCDSIRTLVLNISQSSTGIDSIEACSSFNWIDGNTYFSNNDTATHTLTNIQGCDSIVTLNLSVLQVDTSINIIGDTLISNSFGAIYQWVDCDNDYAYILGEISQDFIATNNGAYAVIIEENGCVDTSDCVDITGIGWYQNSLGLYKIYPNPNFGYASLEFKNHLNYYRMNLRNSLGQLILWKEINESVITFEIDGPNGIYYLEMVSESGNNSVIKLIKL